MPYKDKEKQNKYTIKWRENNPSYGKEWKENNKEKVKQNNKKRRQRLQRWWKKYKSTLFCIKCGESRAVCLDFHHRDPNEKERTVSDYARSFSRKRILEEVAKCDVLCANCHRVEHELTNGIEEI